VCVLIRPLLFIAIAAHFAMADSVDNYVVSANEGKPQARRRARYSEECENYQAAGIRVGKHRA